MALVKAGARVRGCHGFVLCLSSPRCGSVLEHGSSRASPNRSSHNLCPSRRPSPSSLLASPLPLSSSPLRPSTLPGLQLKVRQITSFSTKDRSWLTGLPKHVLTSCMCFYSVGGQPTSGLGPRSPMSPSQLTVSPY